MAFGIIIDNYTWLDLVTFLDRDIIEAYSKNVGLRIVNHFRIIHFLLPYFSILLVR